MILGLLRIGKEEMEAKARRTHKREKVFAEATREGLFMFLLAQFYGILGLGFQDISVGNTSPFWYLVLSVMRVKTVQFFWHFFIINWLPEEPSVKLVFLCFPSTIALYFV